MSTPWILAFEIPTMLLFLFAVALLVKNKDYKRLSNLMTAAVFGITLEYLNMALHAGYQYNSAFLIQVGAAPNNVPITIGLAWGTLLLTVQEISRRLNFPMLVRLLFEAAFVVSTDIMMDVVVIRLDGGFWTWTGIETDMAITNTSFLGVSWMNYIGWFFVIFFVSLFIQLFNNKIKTDSWKSHILKIFTIPILSYAGLYGALFVIGTTAYHHSGLVFVGLYFISILIPPVYFLKNRPIEIKKTPSLFLLIYYLFVYLFSISALVHLELATKAPWFFVLGLILFGITMFIVASITDFKRLAWDEI